MAMRSPALWHEGRGSALLLLVAALSSACGANKGSADADDEDAGIPDGFVAVDVTVEEVFGGAVVGMQICVFEAQPKNCVVTDSAGRVSLTVAENSEFGLTLAKTGFAKELLPTRVATKSIELTPVALPESVYEIALETAGITQASGKGSLLTFQLEGGARASLTPATGEGPYYFNGIGLIDPEATEVPKGGGVLFANLELGQTELVFEHPTARCEFPVTAWASDTTGATRFPSVAQWGTGLWPAVCAAANNTVGDF